MTVLVLVEVLLGCVGCVAFAVLYGSRSPWRESPMGRHMMAFTVVTAGELGSLLALGLGLPVPIWVFALGFGLLDLVIVQRLVLLWRMQRGDTLREE
jgi:hypothetical protein